MKKQTFLAALFFLIITLIFFYPVFKGNMPIPVDLLVGNYFPYNTNSYQGYGPGAVPHKAQGVDVIRQLLPWKHLAIDTMKQGHIPFWNPYNFSGSPLLANFQSAPFYPVNVVFFITDFVTGWSIYILLIPLLASFFTYLFLRELQLGKVPSIFGAIVFAYSSYMVVWLEWGNLGHTVLWLPLLLWLFLKLFQKPTIVKTISIILTLSFSILAGYIQLVLYHYIFLLCFVVFYILYKKPKMDKRLFLYIVSIFVAPPLLTSIQLLPTIELFTLSARTPYPLDTFITLLIPPYHLITVFVPDFFGNPATRNYWINGTYIERVTYIGVLPLLCVLFAFFQKRSGYVWFFAISSIICIVLTFDTAIAKVLYSIYLPPILSTGVPTRMLYLFSFSMSVMAAIGFNALLQLKQVTLLRKTALLFVIIYAGLWIFVFLIPTLMPQAQIIPHLAVSKRNLILPTAILIFGLGVFLFTPYAARFFRIQKTQKIISVILLTLTIGDLFYFFHKITPFAPRQYIFPDTPILQYVKENGGINRFWGYGTAYMDTNFQTYEKLFSTDGYDPLYIKRYGEFLLLSNEKSRQESIKRSDANIKGGFGQDDLQTNSNRQRLLNLLGVEYILNKVDPAVSEKPDVATFPKDTYELLAASDIWQIYENKESLPRAFLLFDYEVIPNKDAMLTRLQSSDFNSRKKVLLETSLPTGFLGKEDKNASVRVTTYEPNKVVLVTNADENGILFLSDNDYPGWEATVDGKNGKIYRADYSFRAVPVEKGRHEVVFQYKSATFQLGSKISAVTFFVLVVAFVFFRLSKKYES